MSTGKSRSLLEDINGSDVKSPISFAKYLMRSRKNWFTLWAFLCLIWVVENFCSPLVARFFMNRIETLHHQTETLTIDWYRPFFTIIIYWFCIEFVFRIKGFVQAFKIQPHFEYYVNKISYRYISKHSYEFYMENQVGNIVDKVGYLATVSFTLIDRLFNFLVPAILSMLFLVGGFYYVNGYLGLIATFSFIVFFTMISLMFRPLVSASTAHSEADNVVSGKMNDSLQNIFHIKSFGREIFESAYLRKYFKQERTTNRRFLLLAEYVKLMTSLSNIFIMGFIFLVTQIELFRRGMINVADVAYCFMSMTNYFFAMWSLGYEMPYIIDEYGICKQSLIVLQQKHTIEDNVKNSLVISNGEVEFKNLFFGYNNRVLFSNLNLKINAKQRIGLVGRSGSGKTSLTNLLMRYFDPISGEILIDNQNIKNISLTSLHNAISIIPQDTMLFDRTILENLRYSNPIASFSQVVEAAKKAQAHNFIVEMINGYDAVVSERGKKMSGGQRQRIAIARAFLKDSPILILDEVTSALDSETELTLLPILNELMIGKTVFVVAHRLHTLVDMDRILVFNDGLIVEDGTHNQLLDKEDGLYAKMWYNNAN